MGDQVFLNNVSLGVYARLVHRRERRRQRGEAFARLRALAISLKDRRRSEHFVVDGQPLRASVVLVANNEYRLDLFSIGERDRVDEGTLAIYAAHGSPSPPLDGAQDSVRPNRDVAQPGPSRRRR